MDWENFWVILGGIAATLTLIYQIYKDWPEIKERKTVKISVGAIGWLLVGAVFGVISGAIWNIELGISVAVFGTIDWAVGLKIIQDTKGVIFRGIFGMIIGAIVGMIIGGIEGAITGAGGWVFIGGTNSHVFYLMSGQASWGEKVEAIGMITLLLTFSLSMFIAIILSMLNLNVPVEPGIGVILFSIVAALLIIVGKLFSHLGQN